MGDIYTNPPQSRNEAILRATIDGTEYTAPPQSRIEDLLLELKETIEQGGGAGGMSKDTYDPDDVVADAGGIAAYVADEITDLDLGTASTKNSTSVVTQSTDLVESGAVKDIVGWGNKNLLNADVLFASASHHDISLSVSNQIISLNGTVSGGSGYYFGDPNKKIMLPAGTYTFSIVCSGDFGTASEIRVRKSSDSSRIEGIFTNNITPVSFTLDTDTEVFIAIVNSNATSGTSVNATLKIQLEKGSTATAYEPYHASVEDTLRDAEVVQGKNLLPTNGYKASTRDSVTFTYNSDGSVTVTGSTDSTIADFFAPIPSELSGDFYFSGCPTGGSYSTFDVYAWDSTSGGRPKKWNGTTDSASDFGNTSQECKLIAGHTNSLRIRIRENQSNINATFKLMLRKPTEDDIYEPYFVPLKDVVPQKCDNSVIGTVEGTTASKTWSVGEHFIQDGQFKEVTQPIASGGAINSSNTVDRPIADCLYIHKIYVDSEITIPANNMRIYDFPAIAGYTPIACTTGMSTGEYVLMPNIRCDSNTGALTGMRVTNISNNAVTTTLSYNVLYAKI